MHPLYVAASDDGEYADVARSLYRATKSRRSLMTVPGALHGVEFLLEPGVPAVRRTVGAFVAAHAR
jgi:hypothetical protein